MSYKGNRSTRGAGPGLCGCTPPLRLHGASGHGHVACGITVRSTLAKGIFCVVCLVLACLYSLQKKIVPKYQHCKSVAIQFLRANATRAAPPFSRLQNACHCPTCSTSCSCRCSPASSAICTGVGFTQPGVTAARATSMALAEQRQAQSRRIARRQDPHRRAPLQRLQPPTPQVPPQCHRR